MRTPAYAARGADSRCARAQLEKVVGFDHGPRATSSNLTLFALLCRDCGARFAWLDAPTEQPAPATALEFMAQRRRAFLSRLSALAASGDGSRGALSTDRRVPLAVLTSAQRRALRVLRAAPL